MVLRLQSYQKVIPIRKNRKRFYQKNTGFWYAMYNHNTVNFLFDEDYKWDNRTEQFIRQYKNQQPNIPAIEGWKRELIDDVWTYVLQEEANTLPRNQTIFVERFIDGSHTMSEYTWLEENIQNKWNKNLEMYQRQPVHDSFINELYSRIRSNSHDLKNFLVEELSNWW